MARTIGNPTRPQLTGKVAAPRPQQPRQQMQRAFGAPQARPAGQKGVPHPDRARPRAQAQGALLNRQRVQMTQAQGMGGSTIDVGRYFGEGVSGGGATGNLKCAECGTGLIAGYDTMDNPDGMGALCKNCWADMWVPHPHAGIGGLGGNTCTMGVRWTPQEWQQLQGITMDIINRTGAVLGRYPTQNDYPSIKQALDHVLGASFKRSMKCQTCHTDVVFSPTADDIPMAGINTQG